MQLAQDVQHLVPAAPCLLSVATELYARYNEIFSYHENVPASVRWSNNNPIQDGSQDLSYLTYFGVDPSESSFGPLDTRHIDYVSVDTSKRSLAQRDPRFLSKPQWGSRHGGRSNGYYSDNSPAMEVKNYLELYKVKRIGSPILQSQMLTLHLVLFL